MQTHLQTTLSEPSKNRSTTKTSRFWMVLSALFLSLSFSAPSYSHRGAADEVDICRIKVGTEKIHFSAYMPAFTQDESFCRFIPNVGMTNLVFDYEGKKLRDVSIEFEVTKEPDGVRVFYQEPKKSKTGIVKADIDFSQHGAGDYLAHVTIVHDGEKLDTHLPFVVGVAEAKIHWGRYLFTFLLVVGLVMIGITILSRRNQADQENSGL